MIKKICPSPTLSTPSHHHLDISRVSPRLRPARFSKKSALSSKGLSKTREKESRGAHYLSFPGDVKIPETSRHPLPSGISRERTWFTIDEKHTSSTLVLLLSLHDRKILDTRTGRGISREKDRNVLDFKTSCQTLSKDIIIWWRDDKVLLIFFWFEYLLRIVLRTLELRFLRFLNQDFISYSTKRKEKESQIK